ncbi:Hypothetical protein GL50581_2999 [Giardia duodenalis ATCC 50581]|nr:Hypothetical protein GL50581_2999 [Giardia intestinalis ATCC 50581]
MPQTPELIIEEIDIEREYKDEITSLQSTLDLERRTNARLLQRIAELENELLVARLPKACEQCKIYCQLLDELQKKSERRDQELTAEAPQHPVSSGPARAVYSAIQPLPAHAITCEEIEPLLLTLSKQSPRNQLHGSGGTPRRQTPRNKRSPRPRSGSANRTRTPKSRSGSTKAGARSGSTRGGQDQNKSKRSPGNKRSSQGMRSAKIVSQIPDYPSGKKHSTSKPSNPRNSQSSATGQRPVRFGF